MKIVHRVQGLVLKN